jgi:hypothetical protein
MKAPKPEALLLANGPSLLGRDWRAVPRDQVWLVGINQSWRVVPDAHAHVFVDIEQMQIPGCAPYYERMAKAGLLFHTGAGGTIGRKLDRHDYLVFGRNPFLKRFRGAARPAPYTPPRATRFRGGNRPPRPVQAVSPGPAQSRPPLHEDGGVALKAGHDTGGSATYVALQIVFAMGFERIWIVGLDGKPEDGSEAKKFTGQRSNCDSHDRLWKATPDDVRARLRVIEPSWTAQHAQLPMGPWPWPAEERAA